MGMNLTAEATSALINTNSPRQGAIVTADTNVTSELAEKGFINKRNGLTLRGTIARERAVNAALEAAF